MLRVYSLFVLDVFAIRPISREHRELLRSIGRLGAIHIAPNNATILQGDRDIFLKNEGEGFLVNGVNIPNVVWHCDQCCNYQVYDLIPSAVVGFGETRHE
jgi:hypothetical protein